MDLAGPQSASELRNPLCFVPNWERGLPGHALRLRPLSPSSPWGPWLLTCEGSLAGLLCLSGSVLIWMQPKLSPSNFEESSKGSPIYPPRCASAVVPTGIRSLPALLLWFQAHLPPLKLLREASFLLPPIRWWPLLARGLSLDGPKASSPQVQGSLDSGQRWEAGWR